MITMNLAGRLGNFMFIVAATYAYSLRHKMDYCIPPEQYFRYFPNLKMCDSTSYPFTQYNEPSFAFNEIPKFEHVKLNGYFQSLRYFEDYEQEVKSLFNFPYKYKEGWVSLHNRLGDYKQYPDRFTLLSDEYIHDSLFYMAEKGFTKFTIFSDGMEETRARINSQIYKDFEFEYSSGNNEYDDMIIGSWCQHNIISASSFSWWQAELNKNEDKIVIAPRNWFPHNELSTIDVCPENWIRL